MKDERKNGKVKTHTRRTKKGKKVTVRGHSRKGNMMSKPVRKAGYSASKVANRMMQASMGSIQQGANASKAGGAGDANVRSGGGDVGGAAPLKRG